MKVLKKTVWAVLFISNICVGQNLVANLFLLEENARVLNDMQYSIDGVDGHKYFLNEWGNGKLIIKDSISAPQGKIQYDMVAGEPIIGNSENTKKGFILRDKSVTNFVINTTHFTRISKARFLERMDRNYYVVPSFTKENYLITDYSKILKEPYIANNGYNNASQNRRFVTIEKHYILNKNNKYIAVKLKEKDILKTLSDKKNELKSYVRKHNLNLKEIADVVSLLTYYHSL